MKEKRFFKRIFKIYRLSSDFEEGETDEKLKSKFGKDIEKRKKKINIQIEDGLVTYIEEWKGNFSNGSLSLSHY